MQKKTRTNKHIKHPLIKVLVVLLVIGICMALFAALDYVSSLPVVQYKYLGHKVPIHCYIDGVMYDPEDGPCAELLESGKFIVSH